MSSGWTSFRSRFGKKQEEAVIGSLPERGETVEAVSASVAAPPEKARRSSFAPTWRSIRSVRRTS
jgi:hypothetical protein